MSWDRSTRRQELPSNWAAIRKDVLARDGGKCVWCPRTATDVDHIDPKGPHALANLRSLCGHCHRQRTSIQAAQERARRRKLRQRPQERHPGLPPQ